MNPREIISNVLKRIDIRKGKEAQQEVLKPVDAIFFEREGVLYVLDRTELLVPEDRMMYLQDPGATFLLKARIPTHVHSFFYPTPPEEVSAEEEESLDTSRIAMLRFATPAEIQQVKDERERRAKIVGSPKRPYTQDDVATYPRQRR